ncbi:unnamed protein product [Caenorhabditis bovis]|uniref:C2H2-type domain-containing protein n=1 Tax=Caenorhabditis bovis TaxID=2654633 RepID=A0A8S1E661_9PELO|nr:unnamed protein product [Caenorhabditis bovis]
MDDYMSYNYYQQPPTGDIYGPPPIGMEDPMAVMQSKTMEPPPPPPIIICPTEVDHINVTLEKNQQCKCKDCGKLFNSVWYLKQHAVKHSNDRPFKCKFCLKTYKFRSNLYQHKCPERQKSLQQRRRGGATGPLISTTKRVEATEYKPKEIPPAAEQMPPPPPITFPEVEDNDAPITYGLVIQNIDQNQLQMNNNFAPAPMQTVEPLMNNDMENSFENQAEYDNRVRSQQLPSQQIEDFVQKNKQKLFSCRKCRVFLPTEESLLRHNASHNGDDLFPYKCANCRQAFETEKELRRHAQLHSLEEGPWRCDECFGQFRSSVALRRHKDQYRPCFLPPVQNNIMVSVHSPIDPFSFIPDSDNLFLPVCEDHALAGADSGIGSEGSPNSLSQASPDRFRFEEAINIIDDKKQEKEDDEDSGFRSRLGSVNQSCSPDSFSSQADSPPRKLSGGMDSTKPHEFLNAFGSGPTYGRKLFFEQPVGGGGGDNFTLMDDIITNSDIVMLPKAHPSAGVELEISPRINFKLPYNIKREISIEFVTSHFQMLELDNSEGNGEWTNDGYDHPSEWNCEDVEEKMIIFLIGLYIEMVFRKQAQMLCDLTLLAMFI